MRLLCAVALCVGCSRTEPSNAGAGALGAAKPKAKTVEGGPADAVPQAAPAAATTKKNIEDGLIDRRSVPTAKTDSKSLAGPDLLKKPVLPGGTNKLAGPDQLKRPAAPVDTEKLAGPDALK